MDRRLVCALLPSLAIGCSLVEDLDGYAGAADSGAGVDSTAADTLVADTAAPDTFVADTFVADTFVADTFVADTFVADTFAPDTRPTDIGVDVGPPPYRHTVTIDGVNDFAAADKFTTTTAAFDAYVSWDDAALYVGYVGSDLGSGTTGATAKKWVLVYVDVDPGAGTGATTSEAYGSQQHTFAAGFQPDVYYALKTDESYQQLRRYSGGAWTNATGVVTYKRNAATNFVELKIPLAALSATPTRFAVTTFMLNEDTAGPWTWAGLWSTSFTDGNSPVSAPKTIANWLLVDPVSSAAPNAAGNKRP